MDRYRKWYKGSLAALVLCMTLVIIFNYVIDPYQLYKSTSIKGLNHTKLYTNDYLWKARKIAEIKPSVLFLGSSRTGKGIDPDYYFRIQGEASFNAGLSSADINVQLKYFQYGAMANHQLRKIYLGLDFEGFNTYSSPPATYSEKRLFSLKMIKEDLISTLFTKKSIMDSLSVVRASFSAQQLNGDFLLEDGSNDEQRLVTTVNSLLKDKGVNRFYDHLRSYLQDPNVYIRYSLSSNKMDSFRQVDEYCKSSGISCTFFIHPSHALQWEGIQAAGRWEEFEKWKREIVEISPIWDFSGFNSITTVSTENFDHYFDQSHYRKHIGNLVLNRMLHVNEESVPDDFGFLITPNNIEQQLDRIREEKKRWEADNPEIVNRVKSLAIN